VISSNVNINPKTEQLAIMGIDAPNGKHGSIWFTGLQSPKSIAILLMVGSYRFGTRYAGGYTSGHAISGLSNFTLSFKAVVGFVGG
jgi:hypothetical protein